jgi:hypothetical protein
MDRLIPNFYKSPSLSPVVTRLENKWLAADDSWWTGRYPLYTCVSLPKCRVPYT